MGSHLQSASSVPAWGRRIYLLGLALTLGRFSFVTFVQNSHSFLGHFTVFTRAAQAFWSGAAPYGTDFGTQVGYYFYSPFVAMFIFGPLSFLPLKLGCLAFLMISILVFSWGFASVLGKIIKNPDWREAAFVLVVPPLYSALLAAKLEVIMMGLLLWSLSNLIEKKRSLATALCLSAICQWKFQPLPTVLLLATSFVFRNKTNARPLPNGAGHFLVGLLLCSILPFFFVNSRVLLEWHHQWLKTLGLFVRESYDTFDNIFKFLKGLSHSVSYRGSQLLSLVAGVILFFVQVLFNKRWSQPDALLVAVSGGAFFSVVFSPLHQNNAYILVVPLILAWGSFLSRDLTEENQGIRLFWWMIPALFLGNMYSDLFPDLWTTQFRDLGLKPVLTLLWGILFYCWVLFSKSSRRNRNATTL